MNKKSKHVIFVLSIIMFISILSLGTFVSAFETSFILKNNNLFNESEGNGMWTLDVVDNRGEVGWYTDIALLNTENIFISYYAGSSENLKLASFTNNLWNNEVADGDKGVGKYSSIAVDSLGIIHISYYDEKNGDLKYAKRTSDGWITSVVDSEDDVGLDTDIALDSRGNPYISYYDQSNSNLKCAHWNDTNWNIEVVDSEGDVGLITSIVLDKQDVPHISYANWKGILKYAYSSSSGWQIEIVDADSYYVTGSGSTSIALDKDFNPHICYYEYNPSSPTDPHWSLKHAFRTNNKWHIEVIETEPFSYTPWNVKGASMVIDNSQRIHIGYFGWDNWDLRYAYQAHNKWNIETVDSEGDVGAYASLAVDEQGYPHISYMSRSDLELKYAQKIQYQPEKPDKPVGPTNIKPGEKYFFTTCSYDFEGDQIRYGWDWGDNSSIEWTGFYDSGISIQTSHIWVQKGKYQIKVTAEDKNGFQSNWSDTFFVTMTRNKSVTTALSEKISKLFLNIFPTI